MRVFCGLKINIFPIQVPHNIICFPTNYPYQHLVNISPNKLPTSCLNLHISSLTSPQRNQHLIFILIFGQHNILTNFPKSYNLRENRTNLLWGEWRQNVVCTNFSLHPTVCSIFVLIQTLFSFCSMYVHIQTLFNHCLPGQMAGQNTDSSHFQHRCAPSLTNLMSTLVQSRKTDGQRKGQKPDDPPELRGCRWSWLWHSRTTTARLGRRTTTRKAT